MNKDMIKAYVKATQKIIMQVEDGNEKGNKILLESIRQIFILANYSGMSKEDKEFYYNLAQRVIDEFNDIDTEEKYELLEDFISETDFYIYNKLER
jgi:uncharacterized protein YneR